MGLFSKKKIPTPTSAETKIKPVVVSSVTSGRLVSHVLLQPLITEKATLTGTYLFKVAPQASKNEIRKEFKAKYGKDPRKVNVLNVMGKVKMRGRIVGKRSDWKKAVIYLAKGETVDVFQ